MKNLWLFFLVGLATGFISEKMAPEVRLNCLLPVLTSLLLSLVIDSHPLSERIFSSTAAIRAASNETIKKAPDIAAEVGQYADLAKRIIELAVFGAAQNRSYRRLADFTDTVGNRVSGSQNLEMAIKYMHNAMTQDGLNVHLEPVKIPHWVRGQESAEMIMPRAKSLAILGLGSSVGTPPEGVKAEVLVVQSFEELKRRASEAAGRIVVFNQPFISYGETVSYRAFGASEAARLGAVATLIRSVTPFSINSPHTGSQTYQEGVKRIPTACITVEDAELMWRLAQNKQKIIVRLIMGAQTLPDADSFNTVAEIRGWQHPEQQELVLVLVVFRFIRDRVAGAADPAETPRRPSPQTPPPALPGGAQGAPRPAERHSPSSVSWAVPWASSHWDVPGTPPEEGVQEASGIDARATSTGSSRCGGAAALL
ncbi:hypothetical protein ATANTOWER_021568 [Ataeniobius toweri]|uniref:Carboxypeptidase Q n=1 Tax=Ataeniobius toweri TaxID=208326 RepID=A0ABU7B2E9_9TELE|nr:hypothetical protein [Ataeniobius toweri]